MGWEIIIIQQIKSKHCFFSIMLSALIFRWIIMLGIVNFFSIRETKEEHIYNHLVKVMDNLKLST